MQCRKCKGHGQRLNENMVWKDCTLCRGTGETHGLPEVKRVQRVSKYSQEIRQEVAIARANGISYGNLERLFDIPKASLMAIIKSHRDVF